MAIIMGLGLSLFSFSTVHARTFQCRAGDVACLIQSIKQANAQPGPQHEIRLEAGTYTLTAVDNTTDGSNGLPSITSRPTIRGVGADFTTIERAASAPDFRLMHVAAGTLTLEGLTLRGGQLTGSGGGLFNRGTVTLLNSTLAGNTASRGGGLYNNFPGIVTLTHSTLAKNTASVTGGGFSNIGSMATLTDSTLAENVAAYGGGIYGVGTTYLQNTLVARNVAQSGGSDCSYSGCTLCSGRVASLGNNLIGDPTDCHISPLVGDLMGGIPGLGPYTDDGTPGNGHFPLLFGSQAINGANPTACPQTDQLGQPRLGVCDIGSIEFQGTAVSSR